MRDLVAGNPTIMGSYFALDAKGRVDPLGVFSGREGVVEYFYGTVWVGNTRALNVDVIYLFSKDDIVYISVDIHLSFYNNANASVFLYNITLRESGSFIFNSDGLVQSTDTIIHNLGPANYKSRPPGSPEIIRATCNKLVDPSRNIFTPGIPNCNSTNDPLGYYNNVTECINYLTNDISAGRWDDLYFNGNTSLCRYYHSLLAVARPSIHCSHSGKSGGGKCLTHDYESYFETNYKKRNAGNTFTRTDIIYADYLKMASKELALKKKFY